MNDLAFVLSASLAVLLVVVFARRRAVSRSARRRLHEATLGVEVSRSDSSNSPFSEWLVLAGRTDRDAPARFLKEQALWLVIGASTAALLARTGVETTVAIGVATWPETIAGLLLPIVSVAHWIVFTVCAAVPSLRVRKERRRRADEIERDLPLLLELLATLAEAGMAFDAALDRILESRDRRRALDRELRRFQSETLSGVPRVRAFRRLADRVRVASLSTFVSALVQAEQLGLAVASVLRQQASDQRSRSRERALLEAQSLPVKLVFPLILCFLPSIFVFTLGPAFYAFFGMTAGVLGSDR